MVIGSTALPIAFHLLLVLRRPLSTPPRSTGRRANGQDRRDEEALYMHSLLGLRELGLEYSKLVNMALVKSERLWDQKMATYW